MKPVKIIPEFVRHSTDFMAHDETELFEYVKVALEISPTCRVILEEQNEPKED